MNLLAGVVLLAATALVMCLMVGLTRRPGAAAWLRADALAVAVALLASTTLVFGLAFLGAGLFGIGSELSTLGLPGMAALVGVVVGTWWASPRLARIGRDAAPVADIVTFPPRDPVGPGVVAHQAA